MTLNAKSWFDKEKNQFTLPYPPLNNPLQWAEVAQVMSGTDPARHNSLFQLNEGLPDVSVPRFLRLCSLVHSLRLGELWHWVQRLKHSRGKTGKIQFCQHSEYSLLPHNVCGVMMLTDSHSEPADTWLKLIQLLRASNPLQKEKFVAKNVPRCRQLSALKSHCSTTCDQHHKPCNKPDSQQAPCTKLITSPVVSITLIASPLASTKLITSPVVSITLIASPLASTKLITTPVVSITLIALPLASTKLITSHRSHHLWPASNGSHHLWPVSH